MFVVGVGFLSLRTGLVSFVFLERFRIGFLFSGSFFYLFSGTWVVLILGSGFVNLGF